ncbi:MAG TPA: penicillin-binding protein 2 [Desulfomonilia bacterium]|nr:penicillin-binding protein 2 [Desulfomonilia bacterium]
MTHNITNPQLDEELKKKSLYLIIFVLVLLGILIMRLFVMQIIKGSYYEELSENNRIRIISVPAARGKILDRTGVVLADNRPAYNVMVLPEDISNPKEISERLAPLLNKQPSEIQLAIMQGKSKPYDPLNVARDITFEQVAKIETQIFNLPGVSIETIPEREYLYQSLGCHVLGFIGEISKKQIENQDDEDDYAPGDLIGKSGIEQVYEDTLRGDKGRRVFEVDARGHRVKVLGEDEPAPGKDIKLTIDQGLQAIASQGLGDRAGAVVAMAPTTGEVLVMESTPGFDPAIFATSMTAQQWKQIIDNPLHPLENRSMRGAYPPGSVMKIVTTLAGFHTGILDPDARVFCPGFYKIGNMTFHCWQSHGHGNLDLVNAIAQSCDVYFYTLGRALGIDNIAVTGFQLGLGVKTGIALPDELPGLMPTKKWKRQRFHQPWHPGEDVISAIGQGYTLVTPLQVARAMSAIVNGGKVYTPKILMEGEPVMVRDIAIPQHQLDLIKAGLKNAVENPRGTGHAIYDPHFSIGGKTGTAQVARGYTSKRPDESDIPYKFRDHAWFFGISPVEKPEIVVVALVEHAGHGGSVCAPIVKDVIEGYYLKKEASREQIRQNNR